MGTASARFVGTGVFVALITLVFAIATFASYADDQTWGVVAGFAVLVFCSVCLAVVATRRLQPSVSAVAVIGGLLVIAAVFLRPTQTSDNLLVRPALLAAAASFALWGIAALRPAFRHPAGREATEWWRSPLVALSAGGLVASGVVLVLALNPIALLMFAAAILLVAGAIGAIAASPHRIASGASALIVAPIPVVATMAIMFLSVTGEARRFEVPEGYTGWVAIEFERPDCPAMPRDRGELVLKADAAGCGCTSDLAPRTFARTTYVMVSSDGVRRELAAAPANNAEVRRQSGTRSKAGREVWLYSVGVPDGTAGATQAGYEQVDRCAKLA